MLGRYIPTLSFLRIILGDESDISGSSLYYQRLLASDPDEARQVLEEYLKGKHLKELYSEVIIPALGLVEQDRHRNELDDATIGFIMQSTREMIEELGDSSTGDTVRDAVNTGGSENGCVLCVPASDEADELVGLLLAQLLEQDGFRACSTPVAPMAEILSSVADHDPALICISALPPFAIDHAKSVYQKLRTKLPTVKIAICLWHFEGDLEKTQRRLKIVDAHRFLFKLEDVLLHVKDASANTIVAEEEVG